MAGNGEYAQDTFFFEKKITVNLYERKPTKAQTLPYCRFYIEGSNKPELTIYKIPEGGELHNEIKRLIHGN